MKVGFISLGCNKNLVDTEKTIAILKNKGHEIVNSPSESELIIINTCGFIESAKEEAINTILEMAEYKNNKCKYLIVMGCLVQRYKEELEKAIPEVDLFIKYDEYDNLWTKIYNLLNNTNIKSDACIKFEEIKDRVISTGNNYAYIKISDGCSNKCTYCAIPYIRGPIKSRSMEDIIQEANKLANEGYKEIILIAQDTTKYGIDIYGTPRLTELLKRLHIIPNIEWIRFLYSYPEGITDDLIKVVKENEKICKYFDIPIQHISDTVLKKMNRKTTGNSIKQVIQNLRKEIPDVVIRTTVMVGFPGEDENSYKELYNFVQETKFNKLGAFAYSKEEGTPAEKLKDQIHTNTKKSRYNKIMELQKRISSSILKNQYGKVLKVLIDAKTFDNKYYIARSYMDVPEIDGVIYIENKKELELGQFTYCKIIDSKDYDLIGVIN